MKAASFFLFLFLFIFFLLLFFSFLSFFFFIFARYIFCRPSLLFPGRRLDCRAAAPQLRRLSPQLRLLQSYYLLEFGRFGRRSSIMGVPALFRWLSNKYPKIISGVIEEQPYEVNGEEVPVDISRPNPNGEEMDNLYLDMNGIVHPCTHPEGKPPPANEQEMMLEIFKYTERVVNMVRPRKLLLIAIGTLFFDEKPLNCTPRILRQDHLLPFPLSSTPEIVPRD